MKYKISSLIMKGLSAIKRRKENRPGWIVDKNGRMFISAEALKDTAILRFQIKS